MAFGILILGLLALASVMNKFRYLKPALVFILFFVGIKMLLSHHLTIPEWTSLAVILTALFGGVLASVISVPEESKKIA